MISKENKLNQRNLWIVVEVSSGIPIGVTACSDRNEALARESSLREKMNPENEEIGIFEVNVNI